MKYDEYNAPKVISYNDDRNPSMADTGLRRQQKLGLVKVEADEGEVCVGEECYFPENSRESRTRWNTDQITD